MRKVTRNDINKEDMISLGYCQCQIALRVFGENYKVGYNSGAYGWNYDLYNINDVSIVTGYRMPYTEYSNKAIKNKLIAFDNKLCSMETINIYKNFEELKQEFLAIFE